MCAASANLLLQALGTLVEAVEPERAERILRTAITQLVAGERQTGRPSRKDPGEWHEIRTALRASMAVRGVNCEALARIVGLSVSALQKASSPRGPVPSDDIIDRLKDWLAAPAGEALTITLSAPAGNGADDDRAAVVSHGPVRTMSGPAADDGRAAVRSSEPTAADSDLCLSEAQRDKVCGYLTFNNAEIRRLLGISKAEAQMAADGEALDPEIMGRLVKALGQG